MPSFSSDAVAEKNPFLLWILVLEEAPHHNSLSSTATFWPGCWQEYVTSLPLFFLLLVSQAGFSPSLDWCLHPGWPG